MIFYLKFLLFPFDFDALGCGCFLSCILLIILSLTFDNIYCSAFKAQDMKTDLSNRIAALEKRMESTCNYL